MQQGQQYPPQALTGVAWVEALASKVLSSVPAPERDLLTMLVLMLFSSSQLFSEYYYVSGPRLGTL